jgi:DNA-binding CsgD family transcriptional regulator
MPHMHLALHRMRMREATGSGVDLAPVTLLSKREIQVLHWVKNGKTNMEIGQILGISPPTVKNHLQKVMRKLNVNNRAQAVGKCATLRLMAHSDLN